MGEEEEREDGRAYKASQRTHQGLTRAPLHPGQPGLPGQARLASHFQYPGMGEGEGEHTLEWHSLTKEVPCSCSCSCSCSRSRSLPTFSAGQYSEPYQPDQGAHRRPERAVRWLPEPPWHLLV